MTGEETEQAVLPPPRRSGGRFWPILVALLLTFAAGCGAAVVGLPHLMQWWKGGTAPQPVADVHAARAVPATHPAMPGNIAAEEQLMGLRLTELEERLTRITVEAQAASGNAARAEGLLVAFAARRALDSGAPLGYVEGQLRLRFGQAQPRAVATIINAAREPVTLVDLQGELDELGPTLTANPQDTGWWTALRREMRELVIVRKSTTPSPLPDSALQRARRLLESGRVDESLALVDTLPNRQEAERWIQMARRYREARRALDLIETAAILEPRQIRATDGSNVAQSSPLAP